jgi:thioredoxin reductase (NADPH)
MQDCEVMVIGGGLAGLAAARRAAELGRRCVALTGPMAPGGLLSAIESVQGLPEHPEGIAGYDLGPMAQDEALDAGASCVPEQALHIVRDGDAWQVQAESASYRAPALVLAMGGRLRALGIPGERDYAGRGVSHCASCDAPLMRGRSVAVIGGGDAACQEALTIARSAAQVHLLVRGPGLRACAEWQARIAQEPRIAVQLGTTVSRIEGDASGVTAVALGDGRSLPVHGVFAYVGVEPANELVGDLAARDAQGRIVVDGSMRTGTPGLLAAGTLRAGSDGQAAQARADGVRAAESAHEFLQNGRWLA